MIQNGSRAQGVGPWDAADCTTQQCNPFKPVGAKNKAPTAGNASRRLIGAHYSDAAPQTALAAAFLDALRRREGVQ
jgi:hypothetical protein